jgi:hypothetical protein
MNTDTKTIIRWNLDLLAKPIQVIHNDVPDLSQAREVLRKFQLVK